MDKMSTNSPARVAVVTGASSGIGKEAAKALAARGWRVIGLGRDPKRTAAAEVEIRGASSSGAVDMIIADLSLMVDAARAARDVAARTDRIDVLLNNAGGMASARVVTADGNEGTFAGNHLGPFLLTGRLLPLLRTAVADAPAGTVRIVNTSSSGHAMSPGLDWNNLQMLDGFNGGLAYCNVKLANILFTRVLAKRLAGDGIVVHAMHPGTVDTNFGHGDDAMRAYMKTLDLLSPQEGADTLVWLATAEEPGRSTAGYFHARATVPTSTAAQDDAAAERLWSESEKLVRKARV